MKGWKLQQLQIRTAQAPSRFSTRKSHRTAFKLSNMRGRFEEYSLIVQSKIHPNGPELVFEQKWVTKNFKPSECVATRSCAGGKSLFPSLFLIGYS